MKIHILGASGSGTTSLGKALAERFQLTHFDSDDYYWQKTDPPFRQKNSVEDRHKSLLGDMAGLVGWILSGSMDSWSDPFRPLFDAVLYIQSDANNRVKRLREREFGEYGDRVKEGGDMFDEHESFIKWAYQYDKGELDGRSRKRHQEWMKTLNCPILSIRNDGVFEEMKTEAINWLLEVASHSSSG
ncbi:MAG: hypothetical protein HRU19_21020 [Pseudobacteriovorax sp.]|nr:hypothetical protein [Pseudobacteriovorax sp.]